jgi:hypothetical protein
VTEAVGRALALRHHTLKSELARVLEDKGAVFLDMFIELNAGACTRKQLRQGSLALLNGCSPQITFPASLCRSTGLPQHPVRPASTNPNGYLEVLSAAPGQQSHVCGPKEQIKR